MSFASLKNETSFDKLNKALDGISGKKSYVDEREWKLTVDKAGNGQATFRFLTTPQKDRDRSRDAAPFVAIYSHSFKGPSGRWYIENCPTTIRGKCPVCENNNRLYESGLQSNKDLVSGENGRKRKLQYYSNIYMIKDPANPSNEGKVFLYKYGPKIFDKIKFKSQPQFEDEEKVDVFHLWKGANFKLKAHTAKGQRTYENSSFDVVSPLLGGDDEKLEKVYNSLYSLMDLVAPSVFKSYEELKEKHDSVIGSSASDFRARSAETVELEEEVNMPDPTGSSTDEDDESMKYFGNLAKLAAED